MTSPFLTPVEAAAYLRVQPSTIYKWVHFKKVPYTKLNGKLVFRQTEIDAWTRGSKEQQSPTLSRFQAAKLRVLNGSLKTEHNC